jgi:hypothetical protein
MWGLLAGGTAAIGAVAYVLMSGKKSTPSAAVKANRKRGRKQRRKRNRRAGRSGRRMSYPDTYEGPWLNRNRRSR